jgi:hypothetical protein
MLVVCPYSTTPRLKFIAVFAPTVVFKVMRVVCIVLFVVYIEQNTLGSTFFSWSPQERIWTIIERVFTAVDNAYVFYTRIVTLMLNKYAGTNLHFSCGKSNPSCEIMKIWEE